MTNDIYLETNIPIVLIKISRRQDRNSILLGTITTEIMINQAEGFYFATLWEKWKTVVYHWFANNAKHTFLDGIKQVESRLMSRYPNWRAVLNCRAYLRRADGEKFLVWELGGEALDDALCDT